MKEKLLLPCRRMRGLTWVVALAFSTSASMAMAQAVPEPFTASSTDASREGSPASWLAPVTVHGHFSNAVGTSNAASQGVIRGELLQDIPLLRPGEALETVPGLVVTQHSGDGKANQYFLRGYNLDHGTDFASSVDGVPVNMPTNAHGQGYSDVNFVIPELVDRINYRKGPYFAQTGDFSSAGSADIQFRRSLDQSIANLTYGADHYGRLLLAGSRTLTGADGSAGDSSGPTLLGAIELQHTNGPWAMPENLHKTNVLLRLSDGNALSGWSLDGIHYEAKWNATDQVPLEMITSGRLGRFAAVDPTDGGNTGRDILSGEWHRADEAGFTRLSAFMEHYRLKLWSDFTLFENGPQGDQVQQAENRNVFGAQAARGWHHSLLGHDSTTEVGVQIRHDHIHVGLQDSVARIPYATLTDDLVGETSTGLYLQNTTFWAPWLRSIAGLREDKVSMAMTARANPLNSGSASGSRASPKLSFILGPWSKTEFFLNAGKGFHSNDARGAIGRLDPGGAPVTRVPALAGSSGKELGVRSEIIDGLQTSLALWSLDSDSEIIYSADDGSTQATGASRRYGLEWNNHWTVNRWLLLDADLAWAHSRYASMNDNGTAGNLIPNSVGKVGLFRAAIHDLGPWSAGIETRYIGAHPLNQDGSLAAPSAIVTNLRVQREISASVSLALDVLNLFDRPYFDIAYGQDYRISPGSPLVPSGITVHPGEPRELRATLLLKY